MHDIPISFQVNGGRYLLNCCLAQVLIESLQLNYHKWWVVPQFYCPCAPLALSTIRALPVSQYRETCDIPVQLYIRDKYGMHHYIECGLQGRLFWY